MTNIDFITITPIKHLLHVYEDCEKCSNNIGTYIVSVNKQLKNGKKITFRLCSNCIDIVTIQDIINWR